MEHLLRHCCEARRPVSAETRRVTVNATHISQRHCWRHDFTDKRMLALGLSSPGRIISRIRKKQRTNNAMVKVTGCLWQYRTLGATTREQSLRQIFSDGARHDGREAVVQRTHVCHVDANWTDSEWPSRSQSQTRLPDKDLDWRVKTFIFVSISQSGHADTIFTDTIQSRYALSARQKI
jgi:hypothetical protein